MSQYASNLASSGGASSNLSVGQTGITAPTYATEIGFISGGNLVGVSNANPLPVTLASGGGPADVNIADFGGTAVTIGQQLMAASMPVVIASNQSTLPISAASLPLPTGASTSSLQSNVQSAPGTPQTTAITIQGNASGVAVPVSGTVTTAAPANTTATGNITNTQTVTITAPSLGQVGILVTGAFSGTVALEISVDGTTWAQGYYVTPNGTIASTFSAPGQGQVGAAGLTAVRIRGNTVASGTATVTLVGDDTAAVFRLDTPLPNGGNNIGSVNQGTSPWIVAGGGTAGSPGSAVLTIQGIAGGTTVPVSGTVTAANASVSTTGSAPPASATYIGGSVTTAAPSYTTGQMNALSLNLSGGLRVDGSGVTQPVSGTVAATQSGTWTVQPGNTANTTAWLVTGTGGTFPATQSGTWNINNISGTITLPTGASTSANQTTLGSQTTKINDGSNTAAVKAASTAAVATDPALVVAISPNNTVKTSTAANANGSFTGSLSVTTTEASTAAPANAVGVVFEAESSNATNIRWGVSNSSGAILSTSSGVLMEPGRSIDFLPIGTGTFLHYISTAAGSNVIDIQWILSA